MSIPKFSRLFLVIVLIIVGFLTSACGASSQTPTPTPSATFKPPTETPIPPTLTPSPVPPTETPIPPTPTSTPLPPPVVGIFYNDASKENQSAINFIQFFPDGKITYILIQLEPGNTKSIYYLYNQYGKDLLKPETPPGKTGTYKFISNKISVEFPDDSFHFGAGGTYKNGKVTFDDNGQSYTFNPLPIGIESTWYLDRSADGKMLYDFIQFYSDGTFSAVQINNDTPPDPLPNAFDIYDTQAQDLLVPKPSKPATSGTYLLENDKITISWENGIPAFKAEGNYTPEKISVTTSKDELLEYLPLPILLDTTYYRNTSTNKQTSYAYLKFYPDLSVSYVEIRLEASQSAGALKVYDTIALPLLQPLPPPPASSGYYSITGGQLKISFPGGYPFTESIGKYTKNKLEVSGSENKTWIFAPLSLAP